MISTPDEWSGGVLLAIAAVESLAGTGKKNGGMMLFYVGFFVEVICAGIQSTALLMLVGKGTYSRLEYGAAFITVAVETILLLTEARIVYGLLRRLEGRKMKDKFATMLSTAGVGTIITISAVPIIAAKFRGKSTDMFIDRRNAYILVLYILSPILGVFLKMMIIDRVKNPVLNILAIACTLIGILAIPLTLGVRILNADDENLSISFLVFSNIIPALLTYMSVFFLNDRNMTVASPENEATE